MTELLERPVDIEAASADALCAPHVHTDRCWWSVGLGVWVCPPSGGRST